MTEYEQGCALNVDIEGGFSDFDIHCTLSCGVSAALQSQLPLDCDMGVDVAGSAAPEDEYQETAETTPDTLDWSVVCSG